MAKPGTVRILRRGGLWALVASGAGVGLGLVREVLIVQQIGLTSVNDRLQSYLSVIYGIGLLNEAIRLGAINLLQTRSLRSVGAAVLPAGAVFAALATAWMSMQLRLDSWPLVVGAALSGWLNMVMVLMVTAKQRGGRFWAPHLINLLPNVITIPAILVVSFLNIADPVPALAFSFYVLPVIQIACLLFVKTPRSEAGGEIRVTAGPGLLAAHGSSAIGNLIFQGVLRQSGLQTADGVLSLLSIAIRMYDSVRFVVVDTLIGKRLAAWSSQGRLSDARSTLERLVVPQGILAVVGVFVAMTFGLVEGMRAWAALGVLVLSIGSFGLRFIYFMINSQIVSATLVWKYGLQDIAVSLLLMGLAFAGAHVPALLLWTWYLAKPFVQLMVVRRDLTGLLSAQEQPAEAAR